MKVLAPRVFREVGFGYLTPIKPEAEKMAFGRIRKSGPLGTTNYLYDGVDLLEELDNGCNLLARYTQGAGIDEPLAEIRSGAISYYQQDALGSSTSLSTSGGVLANSYSYEAFGKLTTSTGVVANPLLYTGREFDSETGLSFYRARHYDSSTGRFLSEDPLRSAADNGTFYRYVRNRPEYFRDPTGRLAIHPGFSPQCLADLLSAIQIVKQHIKDHPCCDRWFSSHGLGLPLSVLVDMQPYEASYDPLGNAPAGEQNTLAYTNPGHPFNIIFTPKGCNSGPTHIAQDLIHEFVHLTLGHYLPWYQGLSKEEEERVHNDVRRVENTCGFALQISGTTVTVNAK